MLLALKQRIMRDPYAAMTAFFVSVFVNSDVVKLADATGLSVAAINDMKKVADLGLYAAIEKESEADSEMELMQNALKEMGLEGTIVPIAASSPEELIQKIQQTQKQMEEKAQVEEMIHGPTKPPTH